MTWWVELTWWIEFAHEFAVQLGIRTAFVFIFYYGAVWLWNRSRAWYLRNT